MQLAQKYKTQKICLRLIRDVAATGSVEERRAIERLNVVSQLLSDLEVQQTVFKEARNGTSWLDRFTRRFK